MRLLAFFVVLMFSLGVFANDVRPMSIKERLRISLWVEGLNKELAQKGHPIRHKKPLPAELEIPLMSF